MTEQERRHAEVVAARESRHIAWLNFVELDKRYNQLNVAYYTDYPYEHNESRDSEAV